MRFDRKSIRFIFFLGAVLFLVSAPYLNAQSFTGQVLGTITDQTGAVLPGVAVTITNTGTNAVRDVITNESGGYTVPGLPAGEYKVEARLSGFRTEVRTGVAVQVNQKQRRARMDLIPRVWSANLAQPSKFSATSVGLLLACGETKRFVILHSFYWR